MTNINRMLGRLCPNRRARAKPPIEAMMTTNTNKWIGAPKAHRELNRPFVILDFQHLASRTHNLKQDGLTVSRSGFSDCFAIAL